MTDGLRLRSASVRVLPERSRRDDSGKHQQTQTEHKTGAQQCAPFFGCCEHGHGKDLACGWGYGSLEPDKNDKAVILTLFIQPQAKQALKIV